MDTLLSVSLVSRFSLNRLQHEHSKKLANCSGFV